jgi:acyl-CoA synthetase (AMP-forming)/AMP-acid ligase II
MIGTGEPGDRVAILAQNCPQYVEVLYGVPASGRILVLLNYRLNPHEWAWIIDNAQVRTVIVEEQYLDALRAVDDQTPSVEHFIVIGNTNATDVTSYADITAAASTDAPPIDIDEHDGAVIIFTSGTTGFPKGAVISHRAVSNAVVHNTMEHEVAPGDRFLMTYPMCHAAAFSVPVNHARGGQVVLMAAFEPERFLSLVAEHRITRTALAPTMATFVLDHPSIDRYDTSSLALISYGGMPMAAATARELAARFGDLATNFGQTESTYTVTCLSSADHRRALDGDEYLLASCGRPIGAAAVAVLDDDLRVVPVGEIGELCIRSDFTMTRYWANEEATQEAFAGGWLHTGDLAHRDADGYLYIVDRKKDMIISGGQNIYPNELERVIATLPGVAEVAVVGTPDPVWGESVCAVVVRRGGYELDANQVVERCQEMLAGYKKPKQVHFVDSLPRNVLGKILKREIRTSLDT